MANKYKIIKMLVDATSYADASYQILKWSQPNTGKYVCVSNVHMCMETYDNPDFCKIVNNADLVVPDGKPLVWAQRLLGEKAASQVRGSDLVLTVCKQAEKNNIPVGLYGSSEKSLNGFIVFLNEKFKNLKIDFSSSPPFRKLTLSHT